VFPDWWDDEAASDPSAFYELNLTIAKRLGLDFKSLLDNNQEIRFRNSGTCLFKTTNGTENANIEQVQALARTLAEMVAISTPVPYKKLPSSALDIRKTILAQSKPWIGFVELVDYLWANGVPVLYLANLHPNWRKMEGMVTVVNNRPVIILTKHELSCAWQLFILAHEVGHIICSHLDNVQTLADDKITENNTDPIEQAANKAAIELLTADSDTKIVSYSGTWLTADDLAIQSIHFGKHGLIDPGHVALNYGKSMKQIPTARAALKTIEPDSNAPSFLTRKLVENIADDVLPEESYLYLLKMCGISH